MTQVGRRGIPSILGILLSVAAGGAASAAGADTKSVEDAVLAVSAEMTKAGEAVDAMRARGLELAHGAFGENIVTRGVDWTRARVGETIEIGEALLEITQIGKECHSRCAIYYAAGDCIMPREGVFARVLHEGTIRRGDPVELLPAGQETP